jgi:DNA polymerase-3 subunit gamma/tau
MDYQALYRKYRPQRFDEVIGQDHVTGTLSREVVEGKIAHAYLFAGPRGTGKTTTARLLAKALNCTDRRDSGEPCNACLSCVGITEGTSLDVIELDAASHNKVEDIREIRVNVGTVAIAGGAHKVYILDEAHMLSRAAGNALLKTLEEPPEHVIFVLATTEPYKLLDTIRSRSQRFDFHPVPVETLVDHLASISAKEGFEIRPGGLTMVATHARGSVRDALSLLEQVAALGGGIVEADLVARALGLADTEAFATLATAIREHDAPGALALVAELAAQGADLRRFVGEALGFFRGVFLAQYAPNLEEVVDEPLDTLEEWRRHAATFEAGDVLRAIDQLSEALLHLRQGREERLVVELTLIRLTRPETALDAASVVARVDRMERQLRQLSAEPPAARGPATPTAAPAAPPEAEPVAGKEPAPAEEEARADPEAPFAASEEPDAPPAPDPAPAGDAAPAASQAEEPAAPPDGLDLETFEAAWPALTARVRDEAGPRRHALLKEAVPVEVTDGTVALALQSQFHLEQLSSDKELIALMERLGRELLGGAIRIAFQAASASGGVASPEPPSRAPDKDDLLEEGDDIADPTGLVADILGGEVVSD